MTATDQLHRQAYRPLAASTVLRLVWRNWLVRCGMLHKGITQICNSCCSYTRASCCNPSPQGCLSQTFELCKLTLHFLPSIFRDTGQPIEHVNSYLLSICKAPQWPLDCIKHHCMSLHHSKHHCMPQKNAAAAVIYTAQMPYVSSPVSHTSIVQHCNVPQPRKQGFSCGYIYSAHSRSRLQRPSWLGILCLLRVMCAEVFIPEQVTTMALPALVLAPLPAFLTTVTKAPPN